MTPAQGITPVPAPALSQAQRSLTPKGKRLEAKAMREQGQRLFDTARLLEFEAAAEELDDALKVLPGEDA